MISLLPDGHLSRGAKVTALKAWEGLPSISSFR